ncbi:hypothetical protein ACFW04_014750 [Cataglyphis niger]
MECRHPSGTANFSPPPNPVVKPSVKTPFCKVSKLKKTIQPSTPSSSSIPTAGGAKLNHTIVKRTTDQANLCASGSLPISSSPRSPLESIPVQTTSPNIVGPSNFIGVSTNSGSSPGKSPGTGGSSSGGGGSGGGQPRRKRLKTDRSLLKDREYDPDRHCGVWNEETGKPCTRSLTCKAHTVSLRRTVVGRSKTFDKLLAEHRAAKEQPNSGSNRQTTKMTISGTVTISSTATVAAAAAVASSLNTPLTLNAPVSIAEPEAPSSPPVLSLPDTYPLPPKAVDLLYRCLAPHGSTKPTKLEEDFANEELRNLKSTMVINSTIATDNSNSSSGGGGGNSGDSTLQQSGSMMGPISVMLPSLSPLSGVNNEESSAVATLIPSTTSAAMPIISMPLPTTCVQPPTVVATVLEGETPVDIDTENMSMYSPIYTATKDAKSQLVMQIQSRPNNHSSQSPVSVRNYQQIQASMPSLNLFEPIEQLEQQHASQINGKRLNHANPMSRQQKRHSKLHHEQLSCQSSQDYSTSASIQVEATTTSPYPHFGDISWSNCHPEPLAVSRWLRISSSRKQYNFNIH